MTDIVCLVHNNLPVTKRFVDSLFENTENFRLIFVDNGSDKETSDYLKDGSGAGKWDLIRSEINLGVIKGRNLGATHVRAGFFMNIDNDQFPQRKDWLFKLHSLMNEGYDVTGVEAWLLSPPNKDSNVVINGQSVNRPYFPIKRCTKIGDKFSYIGCGGMLIRKLVYDRLGLFDERFGHAFFEDPDFGFRCIQNGIKLGWCHDSPVLHLAHQTIGKQNMFSKHEQFMKSWDAFYKKWNPFYPEPSCMKK